MSNCCKLLVRSAYVRRHTQRVAAHSHTQAGFGQSIRRRTRMQPVPTTAMMAMSPAAPCRVAWTTAFIAVAAGAMDASVATAAAPAINGCDGFNACSLPSGGASHAPCGVRSASITHGIAVGRSAADRYHITDRTSRRSGRPVRAPGRIYAVGIAPATAAILPTCYHASHIVS